jgi:hypothetical protein
MMTNNTPTLRIFFIALLKPEDSYIPPKSDPDGTRKKPAIVISVKRITVNRLMDCLLDGFMKISAISTRITAAVSRSSWRIIEKSCRFI